MKLTKIKKLSISECCAELNIDRQQLPAILDNISGKQETVDRLRSLLNEDLSAFKSCSTIEQFEGYLALWTDGLHREKAVERITQLKAEALAQKKKARKIRNIILLIISVVVIVVVCLINYFPVSFLDVSEDISFGKRGGNKTISILTDAKDTNVDVQVSSDWISVDKSGGTLSINVMPNTIDDKTAYITVNASSSFFGKQFNCISRTIKVSQSSGLPTFFDTNISEVSFDKYGNSTSNQIIVKTDGCGLQVSTSASWFSVSKDIKEDGDDIIAYITLSSDTNNEGDKTGEVVVSCSDYVKRIAVSQASGLATRFEPQKSNIDIDEDGVEEGYVYVVKVDTDGTTWSVEDYPKWLTSVFANIELNRLEVKVGRNTGKILQGTITIKSNNGDLRDISVFQDGNPTDFRASKSTVKFGTSSDYEYVTIYNNSHKSLEVSESESWLSATAIGNDEIKISCTSNSNDRHSGTVYVRCGDEQISITVKQDGWTTCWNCGGHGRFQCQYPGLWGAGGYHYVQDFVINNYTGMGSYVYNPCPNCGGSGTIKCSQCDGTGRKKSVY